jgi:hypothetical protein
MPKTCLLIAERFEPTADLLIAELRRREVPCVRWNLDDFPVGSSLTFRISETSSTAEIVTDGRRLRLDDVGSVWCRNFEPQGLAAELNKLNCDFARIEAERVLAGLLTIADVLWMNHPHRHILANSKPAQLFTARKIGLDIPKTLITNDPEEVRQFVASAQGEIIYKAQSQKLRLESGKSLFTGVLTRREMANIELIRLTPGVFQERIRKAYEVRVTVVGPRIFSGKIESQKHVETMLDWRRKPFDMETEPYTLPADIETKVRSFMEAFGLVYGAFDFIVTPEGRYVFLEVNPGGQYMWVEARTGLEITACLVDVLSEPCTH